MLVSQNANIGHQHPVSFAHTVTRGPAWMERQWYSCQPVANGDMMLMIGLGYHPNRNVMDAFVSLWLDRQQHNVQVSCRLGGDPLTMHVGSLKIDVLARCIDPDEWQKLAVVRRCAC